MAADGVQIPVWSGGQQWLVSWHPPPDPPDGTPHGAGGVCVTPDGDIVVISPDGTIWDLPAGRPEPGESWEQTLRREMPAHLDPRRGHLAEHGTHAELVERGGLYATLYQRQFLAQDRGAVPTWAG